MPFFNFWHYFLFCGSAWTGMSHEYRTFDDFINCRGDFKNIPKDSLILPAFKRFGQMLLCMVALIIISMNVKKEDLLTEWWASSSFVYKVAYMIAVMHIKVVTCYLGFTAMEANFIACGQSYKPA